MAEKKYINSPYGNNKITTNCWTAVEQQQQQKKHPKPLWNLPEKIPYIQKQRKSHSEMVGGA